MNTFNGGLNKMVLLIYWRVPVLILCLPTKIHINIAYWPPRLNQKFPWNVKSILKWCKFIKEKERDKTRSTIEKHEIFLKVIFKVFLFLSQIVSNIQIAGCLNNSLKYFAKFSCTPKMDFFSKIEIDMFLQVAGTPPPPKKRIHFTYNK